MRKQDYMYNNYIHRMNSELHMGVMPNYSNNNSLADLHYIFKAMAFLLGELFKWK